MADRYTYIPLIGLFIIVAWGITDLLSGWKYRNRVFTVVAPLDNFAFISNRLYPNRFLA